MVEATLTLSEAFERAKQGIALQLNVRDANG
jgi:hypothetical protein